MMAVPPNSTAGPAGQMSHPAARPLYHGLSTVRPATLASPFLNQPASMVYPPFNFPGVQGLNMFYR